MNGKFKPSNLPTLCLQITNFYLPVSTNLTIFPAQFSRFIKLQYVPIVIAGRKIAPNTGTNATKVFTLATKS